MNSSATGFSSSGLKAVADRIRADVSRNIYDGAHLLVAQRGEIVLEVCEGFSRRSDESSLQPDAAFSIMSITKTMTAVLVLQRIENGTLGFMTKIADIIPEFAQNGKSNITVGQLLAHTGGLGLQAIPLPTERQGDLAAAVQAVCKMTPETLPGDTVAYSPTAAYTVLAEVIRRLDGGHRSYRQIMAEDLFEPLQMHDSALGVPPRLDPRRVPLAISGAGAPELNPTVIAARDKAMSEDTELPAGGVYATASDVLRFAEALRLGGALDGGRILSPRMVGLMASNHTGTEPNSLYASLRAAHGVSASPAYIGLGVYVRGEGIFPSHFGTLVSPSGFGSFGLGSSAFWVDPVDDISFVMLTSGLESLLRFQRIGDMVLANLLN